MRIFLSKFSKISKLVFSPFSVAKMSSGRLPPSPRPTHYALTFEPDFKTHTFKGQAEICVNISEPCSRVRLNISHLSVTSVSYQGRDDGKLEPEVTLVDNEAETLTIDFAQDLQKGFGILAINFKGQVNDSLKGLFRSKYKGQDGQTKFHYVTKFEPAFARWAFPCWDEPAIKATYSITLIVPKDLVALSNMPVASEEEIGENKIVKFQKSVKMSTYVMAFAIGEFDYIEGNSFGGDVLCRVYTPVGKKARGTFALDIVRKAIPFYEEYFGVKYPLPKMDFLCVAEYPCGAMENWGIVVFKEVALLVDDVESSTGIRQRVALTTTHETAHMWFGNYATMSWWNDLWLNEGYATFVEHLATDHIFPEYLTWESFVADTTTAALELDGLSSSHPIQVEVDKPSSVGEIFDGISYYKGASIIRMLYSYIGESAFKSGMKLYLTKHAFGNAETEDLWDALGSASGQPVDKIMPGWTKQMGYPILIVKDGGQKGDERVFKLSYEKYFNSPNSRDKESLKTSWAIPISFRKQSEPQKVCDEKVLIEVGPQTEFEVKVKAGAGEWVKFNPDYLGYYRVIYPAEILNQFVPSIKDKSMGPIDRLQILEDMFASVIAGLSSSGQILELLKAYEDEDNYTVWLIINKIIVAFATILEGKECQAQFKAFALTLFTKMAVKLGWEPKSGESSHDANLRTLVLNRLVGLEHEETLKEATKRFYAFVEGKGTLHPDTKGAVYRAAILGGEGGFEELLKLYRSSDLLEERYRILRALGLGSNDSSLLQKALEFGMSPDVNKQDIAILLIAMGATAEGRVAAWEHFKNNVAHFQAVYPSGGWYLRYLVKVPEDFSTAERADEVEAFFAKNKFSGVDRAVAQGVEKIRMHQKWLERDLIEIGASLGLK